MTELLLPWRRPDPSASGDETTRALLRALRALPAPAPVREFRADLRTQLVAIAPRLVDEGTFDAAGEPPSPRGYLRPAIAVAGALVSVCAIVVSLLVVFSDNSVPGDTLYGLKRAGEDLQMSLNDSDVSRGKTYLAEAETRADEVLAVWTDAMGSGTPLKSASQIPAQVAELINETLVNADADLQNASRLITVQAVKTNSVGALTDLADSLPSQVQLLKAIAAKIPPGALQNRVMASAALASAVLTRVTALRAVIACKCLGNVPQDSFGPLPCVCAPLPSAASVAALNGTTTGSSGSTTTGGPPASAEPTAGSGPTAATAPTDSGGGVPVVPPPDTGTAAPATTDNPTTDTGGAGAPTSAAPESPTATDSPAPATDSASPSPEDASNPAAAAAAAAANGCDTGASTDSSTGGCAPSSG
jgi:Domain of unknown function (DUF5667)